MLSNAYFLAKFRFGTAENEPAKNLQIFPILLTLTSLKACGLGRERPGHVPPRAGAPRAGADDLLAAAPAGAVNDLLAAGTLAAAC